MSARTPYTVLSRLSHDGTHYEPGEIVEMPPRQAAQLIEAAVLAPAPDAPAERASAPAGPDPDADLPTLIVESHRTLMGAVEALRRDVAALSAAHPEGRDPSPGSGAGEEDPAAKGDDPAPGPEPGAGEPASRHDRITVAIADLTPGQADHWTRAGKPEVAALRAATGLDDVTAAERDAAWAAYQAHD